MNLVKIPTFHERDDKLVFPISVPLTLDMRDELKRLRRDYQFNYCEWIRQLIAANLPEVREHYEGRAPTPPNAA